MERKTEAMLLSIIIPVYKSEATLVQCVDSVLKEAPLDSEIILVDDGSPDTCPKMCDEYAVKDLRVRVIHQQNSGASVARNTGLNEATGDFVFFLDSDDYLTEGYFNKLLSHNADLVLGNFIAFYSDGNPDFSLDVSCTQTQYDLHEFLNHFHVFFPTLFNFPWGKIYKREIILNNNIHFDSDIAINEDLLFNLVYYSNCKNIAFEKDAIVMYRQASTSLSKRYYPQLFDWYIKGYTQIREILVAEKAYTAENERYFYKRLFGNVMECITGSMLANTNERKECLKIICNNQMVQSALDYNDSFAFKMIVISAKSKNIPFLVFSTKMYLLLLKLKKTIRGFLK